jgi:hypothetical protein
MAMNMSHYLDEAIFDMTRQNKKTAWKKLFSYLSRNSGIYAYEISGQCSFPLYGTAGDISARVVVYLVKGHPLVLDGGSLGIEESVHKDIGGAWRPIVLNTYSTNPFDALNKIYQAFHELKAV